MFLAGRRKATRDYTCTSAETKGCSKPCWSLCFRIYASLQRYCSCAQGIPQMRRSLHFCAFVSFVRTNDQCAPSANAYPFQPDIRFDRQKRTGAARASREERPRPQLTALTGAGLPKRNRAELMRFSSSTVPLFQKLRRCMSSGTAERPLYSD